MEQSTTESPEELAWILNPTRTIPAELSRGQFEAACELAINNWQVCAEIGPRLVTFGEHIEDRDHLVRLQNRIDSAVVFGRILNIYCVEVCSSLARARIPYVLLKGSASRLSAYSRPENRVGLDVDVAVPYDAIYDAEFLIKGIGFWAAEYDKSTNRFFRTGDERRRIVESRHFELGFLAKRQVIRGLDRETHSAVSQDTLCPPWHTTEKGELECFVSVDIHHGLGLDLSALPMINNTDLFELNHTEVRIPRIEWLVFHLIYKTYWEGVHFYAKGLYQLTDLSILIPKMEVIEFQRLVDLLEEYNLEVAGYYVLKALNKYLGVDLSEEQKNFLAQMRNAQLDTPALSINDLGDMWPKLWGLR